MFVLLHVVLLFVSGVLLAAEPRERRALPPEAWPADVVDVFFDDAREHLVGPRPEYTPQAPSARPVAEATSPAGSGFAWSNLIDADTLETEIKRHVNLLEPLVANPSAFKGGGYRDCRTHFSWLAVLFAVSAEFDERARWQDVAQGLAQLYGRAGANAKVGTDQSFRESQLRAGDLAELVRGGRPEAPPAQPDVTWDQIAGRSPLMQRMEVALDERLSPGASSGSEFRKNSEELRHEAQLLAVLAEVIANEDYDYADDEGYHAYATQLRDAAVQFTRAIDLENYESARAALGEMGKACSNCHDEFR